MTNDDRLKLLVVNRFRAGVFTRQQVKKEWQEAYPDIDFDKDIIMSDYCVNTPSGPNKLEEHRFLFSIREGVYRMYDPQRDGKWKRVNKHMEQVW